MNADTLASHLAAAIGARRLVIAGEHRACSTPRAHDREADQRDAAQLVKVGTANKGMVAKLQACRAALQQGVGDVVIAGGRTSSSRGWPTHASLAGCTGGAMKVTFDDIQTRESQHVLQTYRRQPVAFVRGKGPRLYDVDGREYSTSCRVLASHRWVMRIQVWPR